MVIDILVFCRPIKSFTKISVNFALARWLGRPPRMVLMIWKQFASVKYMKSN